MKEVVAVIRMNMVGKTKEALLKAGIPAITCKEVLGRGKKKVDFSMVSVFINENGVADAPLAEEVSEYHRLISKRMITIVVNDEDLDKTVKTIMEVNSKGNAGDGKIFVTNVVDAVRVRTGETAEKAI
ncbi:P-II family nitrogen regulator [Clostridium cellulovorans]|uniref:Nitrogen regulatory protein P-II n=1 Tax=Clostridium cellulovorans (strain ATCC 35296 / DSM 3052 / OCM 3 / 743B) TaxID=573061 RepID=D9SS83_CLOC7|nr:P-II family nitrogen regulator [Clostridium cellulovorans]ADL52530.1 nitrogen regulatory protein P-II [Clostridium cellulovorans 743B]